MELTINAKELRKALAEIEEAENNGFMFCKAVFQITKAGKMLTDCEAEYNGLWERASETDFSLDWGRFQNVVKRNKFINGRLEKIKNEKIS